MLAGVMSHCTCCSFQVICRGWKFGLVDLMMRSFYKLHSYSIQCIIYVQSLTGPDSVMVRAFASEAGGAGSNPGRVIPKTLKMVPVAALLGAQH